MNVTAQPKTPADMAHYFSKLGRTQEACQAYTLALQKTNDPDPDLQMEGAMYLLQFGADYLTPYNTFLDLYRHKEYQEECLDILTEAFYLPNEKELKARYEKNCRLLAKYPYCFRKDFVPFEDLPIRFYPYDEKGYLPFHRDSETFDAYVNFNYEVISHYFFKDLEKPILADDIYSQYELEYLNDNVRKSEWVARENHIYLHYTDWATFCSYLQVLEWRGLLAQKKIVLLIEDEIAQYPIDFKARFGIDYSQYTVKPLGIREVNRMIWHTQLSYHNGGDFFNEIFDAHPNLLYWSSEMYDDIKDTVSGLREDLKVAQSLEDAQLIFEHWHDPRLVEELYHMKNRTDKDILVALYMASGWSVGADKASRIVPAVFFQPHFGLQDYLIKPRDKGDLLLVSDRNEELRQARFFQEFKYIKTFSPMRRVTTSFAATIKFMNGGADHPDEEGDYSVFHNEPCLRIQHRSFMVDEEDRRFRDSVLVRFEDGKLNPKATFTALCAFLDLPYTDTMTYCSEAGMKNPHSNWDGWYAGFDLTGVYKTYDEYAGNNERCYVEYFLRDAYQEYGYDFNYYDSKPMDETRLRDLTEHFDTFYALAEHSFDLAIRHTFIKAHKKEREDKAKAEGKCKRKSGPSGSATDKAEHETEKKDESKDEDVKLTEAEEEFTRQAVEKKLQSYKDISFLTGKMLMLRGLRFVNKNGKPLKMMKKLELDPNLLENPIYH